MRDTVARKRIEDLERTVATLVSHQQHSYRDAIGQEAKRALAHTRLKHAFNELMNFVIQKEYAIYDSDGVLHVRLHQEPAEAVRKGGPEPSEGV